MPPDQSEPEVVHHHHYHETVTVVDRSARREMPVKLDPLATYDFLGRKQPKRIFGFVEICRVIPGFINQFPLRVPSDRWVKDAERDCAIFDCVCGEVVEALFNQMEDCPGACGRTFVYVGSQVLVQREGPETSD